MGLLKAIKEAGGGLLDMSTPARKKRGDDMGFDTDATYYHGTDEDFDAFDPASIGSNFGFDKKGFFFTTSKDSANRSRKSYPEGSKFTYTDAQKKAARGGRVIEANLKLKNPLTRKDIDGFDSGSGGHSPIALYDMNRERIEKALESGNYDGVKIKAEGQTMVTVLDPSQIRSVDAAFDPAKSESSNLLASNPVATTAAGAGGLLSMTASDDSEASFLGPLARMADHSALAVAKKMDASGINPQKIWNDTGWGKGSNGAWKFEISDADATFSIPEKPKGILSEYVNHPELYENYPDLAGARFMTSARSGASYKPKQDLIDISKDYIDIPSDQAGSAKGVSLHEVQHAIQGREPSFSGGAEVDTNILHLSGGMKHEIAPYVKAKGMYGDDERAAMSAIGDIEYINSLDKIANATSPKPSAVTKQSDWYEFSEDIVSTIGPMPKKAGGSRDEWVRGAAAYLRNKAKDNLSSDASIMLNRYKESPEAFSKLASKHKKLRSKYGKDATQYDLITKKYDNLFKDTPKDRYYASTGEREAYDVQDRLNMSVAERRGSLPQHLQSESMAKQWSRPLPTNPKALAASGLLAATGAKADQGAAPSFDDRISGLLSIFSMDDERPTQQQRMTPALMEYAKRVNDWKAQGWHLPEMPNTSRGKQGILSQIGAIDQEELRRRKEGYIPTSQEQGLIDTYPLLDLIL